MQHYGQKLFSQLWTGSGSVHIRAAGIARLHARCCRRAGMAWTSGRLARSVSWNTMSLGANVDGETVVRAGLYPRRQRAGSGAPPDCRRSAVRVAVQWAAGRSRRSPAICGSTLSSAQLTLFRFLALEIVGLLAGAAFARATESRSLAQKVSGEAWRGSLSQRPAPARLCPRIRRKGITSARPYAHPFRLVRFLLPLTVLRGPSPLSPFMRMRQGLFLGMLSAAVLLVVAALSPSPAFRLGLGSVLAVTAVWAPPLPGRGAARR